MDHPLVAFLTGAFVGGLATYLYKDVMARKKAAGGEDERARKKPATFTQEGAKKAGRLKQKVSTNQTVKKVAPKQKTRAKKTVKKTVRKATAKKKSLAKKTEVTKGAVTVPSEKDE